MLQRLDNIEHAPHVHLEAERAQEASEDEQVLK
jgi:hypothetical protein